MLEVAYPTIAGQTLTQAAELPQYVLYLFNAGMFVGFFAVFISLIWAGVLYFLSPAKADLRADAKDMVGGAISGLLILALTYLILTTINPQLKFLNFNKLPEAPPPPEQKKPGGVYFYKEAGCADENAQANTSDIADLGDALKNQIKAVGIIQNPENQTYYIPILYDAINLQGKCQYLNPNQSCHSVDSFALSASILRYNQNPNGDGVYFYRKSYFEEKGGSFKVSNSEIGGAYPYAFVKRLEDLKFQNVPKEEQDCGSYDKNGECVEDSRTAPALSGENISSVKIKGSYVVLFLYLAPGETSTGPWTYCQAFPTVNDINKIGPVQIKWENARNHENYVPNYVVIIPIKK
ncbi:MAG: hypothetical protein A2358_02620 [Candidatus Staskawiczbacteria bacterium RIFOXYB1_FULL_37_44]|uniref:Uncharacterized protein n=1 Tax=Candidatus Staskawiczbacteria bacterium RIFOXYB1_FULL_37_44 TaxID=1802223 RepID=A0A1G2IUV5_9BACT|nr:MAG: hypothetical protein A2358_02620 [Candidatus Staskawiczbacteria bacterium RIFOXYB1_FULL_37_44]